MKNTIRNIPAAQLGNLIASFMQAGLAFDSVYDDVSETFTITVTGY